MTGFVKLRRGLAEHVSSRRMTLVEHGAYTLLLQLADHSTGRWRGTQRSFAAAAGVSSGLAWKILTSLDRKGYLRWDREKRVVQICRFFVEKAAGKPVEDPVETHVENHHPPQVHDHHRNQPGHARDRHIRNTRILLEKTEIASALQPVSGFPSLPVSEIESQNRNGSDSPPIPAVTAEPPPPAEPEPAPDPAALAEVLREFRRMAVAKALVSSAARPRSLRERDTFQPTARTALRGCDRSPP